jgi:BASS family bile acid:Na+ symporter
VSDSAFIDIGLPLVLAFVMIGIGLTLQVDDFVRQKRKPLASVVGILGWAIGIPLIGFATAAVFNLQGALAIGLILVAATSGGTTSNVMAYLGRGNVALGLVLTVTTALLSIVTLPFWVGWALRIWGDDLAAGSYVSVSFADVAGLLVVIIFVPVGLGMLIRNRKPALAARLERTVSLVSFVVLFGLIIGVIASLGSQAWSMLAAAGPACLVLATVGGLLGLGLGILSRLDRPDHIAMAMEFAIKNVTLSMLIALSALGSDEMALPSAVYGVVAYLPGLALMYFGRRYTASTGTVETEPSRRPIVVGYSGTDASMPAVKWAAAEAMSTQRPLRVVMAWGMPTFGISPVSEAADLDRPHAELVLNAAVLTLRAEMVGLEVEGALVRGKPAQGLLDNSADAALVVVGNRARSGLSRLVLGSVSTAVVTHAEVPVVLVREDAGRDGDIWREGPVVVGVDGSAGSEAAASYAMEASVRHGMTLVAVHILDEQVLALTGSGGGTATRGATAAQQAQLRELSPALVEARKEYPAVTVNEVIEAGNASDVIVAAGSGAALTVVGSRGHGGFKGILLGSVSRAVIEHVESPVAVIRPAETDA